MKTFSPHASLATSRCNSILNARSTLTTLLRDLTPSTVRRRAKNSVLIVNIMLDLHNRYVIRKRKAQRAGSGLLNNLINNLPFELHLPGYNYCGPGTRLLKRLSRGDKGVNQLDEACKRHDIAYAQNKELSERHKADIALAEAARARLIDKQASFGERIASFAVDKIMRVKVKRGMGVRNTVRLNELIRAGRVAVKQHTKSGGCVKPNTLIHVSKRAIARARKGRHLTKLPRVIPLPKRGGFLPLLIPILTALGAAGAAAGGVTTAAKNIKDWINQSAAGAAAAKGDTKIVGKGVYMRPHKKGWGLFLTPHPKN